VILHDWSRLCRTSLWELDGVAEERLEGAPRGTRHCGGAGRGE
jgi:hypothetical protein